MQGRTNFTTIEWSVVIPTLWIPKTFPRLLKDLCSSNNVVEVLVICNAPKPDTFAVHSDKIRFINCQENIFVNPAWNLGLRESKSRFVVICNDDVLFNPELLQRVDYMAINESVIGCSHSCFTNIDSPLKIVKGHSIGQGWGCLMLADKNSFQAIPEELKIWFGDNWLALKYPNCKSFIWSIQTEMGESTRKPDLRAIATKDRDVWLSKTNPIERLQLQALRTKNGGSKTVISVIRHLVLAWSKKLYYVIYVRNFKTI
jgi:glycosyltransferase involved in cell wall biosynthesis